MKSLMVFENHQVEVLNFDGTVLFNPYHVGKCIDLSESAVRNYLQNMNEKQAILITNLDVRNKDIRKLNNAGEKFLTESGLYKLIFKSRKPEAERFTDWVTDEVLPSIRKTGKYEAKNEKMPYPIQVLTLNGMPVVENMEIARYLGMTKQAIRHRAQRLGDYGILVDGQEMARFKRQNPEITPYHSCTCVYSLDIAIRIIESMNAKVVLKEAKQKEKVRNESLNEALAAFNYLVKNRPNTENDDINKAFATVLMGIYVDISEAIKRKGVPSEGCF